MHHAAAGDLQPAGVLADAATRAAAQHAGHVDFGRRLGEREVRRPQAHLQVALEERFEEAVQHGLHVREADALADHQAFDLVEHRRVRDVVIVAIHAARRDHRERRLARAACARICTGEVCVRSSLPSGK